MRFVSDKLLPRAAICLFMGWEYGESAEYIYHYGKTKIPVYSYDDGYICCTQNNKTPVTNEEFTDSDWVEATGEEADYIKEQGLTIWLYITED